MENAGEPRGDQDQQEPAAESPGSRRPFQFSDFKKQPVRPESPNVSDCSGGGRKDSASALPNDDPDDDVFKSASEQEEVV